ncbi:MAG: TRAFs-binding domain-containing protein [Xanthobacteraceae bacterium]
MEDLPQPPPLCFVLMPFGKKMDAAGRMTNFDLVYERLIVPAVEQAGLEPIRADEEKIGGTIHKPMFERLMLCHYAVADITGANPNVFYELGIRHALRPRSTVLIFLEGTVMPFDIVLVRGIPYKTDGAGVPIDIEAPIAAVAAQLKEARGNPYDDSPVYQLIDNLPRWEIDHTKTDVFREIVDYSKRYKARLAAAVKQGAAAVESIAAEPAMSNLLEVESGIVVDLFLSMRDVQAYDAMIKLYQRMPPPLQRAKMMREQFGFALNRIGRFEEAEAVLTAVIEEFGPSSETNGLLGRIYKDRWEQAKQEGRLEARAFLQRAIKTYAQGFEADWRDAYPGINALTLMEMLDRPDPTQAKLLPVVRYAALQKAKKQADYWDHATLLELAVLAKDKDEAETHLAEALAAARHSWELDSTCRNLGFVYKARSARGEDASWVNGLAAELEQASKRIAPPRPAT